MVLVTSAKRATWYRIIHDIIPTKAQLHKIRIAADDKCHWCGDTDTPRHRLVVCGE